MAPLPALPVLVCADAFAPPLRATEAAAAIGRGLERAGLVDPAPDLCPVSSGGAGTFEVLLTALGGETGGARVEGPVGEPVLAGYGVIEDGGTAIVEAAAASGLALVDGADAPERAAGSTRGTGELIVAAAAERPDVLVVAAGGDLAPDGGAGAIAAIDEAGGIGDARLVVLCDTRSPFGAAPDVPAPVRERLRHRAAELPRDPRSEPMTAAGAGLAGALWAHYDATLVDGTRFVLDAIDFDARMHRARCVVVAEARLDDQSLDRRVSGEVATRARQNGVPAHALCGEIAIDRFGARIIDLQVLLAASTPAEIELAAAELGRRLEAGEA